MMALGIDPGLSGAFVLTDGKKALRWWAMPLVAGASGGKEISTVKIREIIKAALHCNDHYRNMNVFLEKAVSFGMGTKSAFNYGRGFERVCLGLEFANLPYTLVEPNKWTKVMHEGLQKDLKPKAKSLMAVKKLYPNLVGELPTKRNGELFDGFVDALLIAGYGLKTLTSSEDFY